MSRWQYWIVLVITTGLALSEARGELTTAKKPNIILVLADDVGYEALGLSREIEALFGLRRREHAQPAYALFLKQDIFAQ